MMDMNGVDMNDNWENCMADDYDNWENYMEDELSFEYDDFEKPRVTVEKQKYPEMSDEDRALILRLSECNNQDWEEFVKRHQKQLEKIAQNQGIKPAIVEDIVQEIYLKLCTGKIKCDSDRVGQFWGLLKTCMSNAGKSYFRKNKRLVELPREYGSLEDDPYGEEVVLADPRDRKEQLLLRDNFEYRTHVLNDVLSKAKPETAEVYKRLVFDGCNASEVAKLFGIKKNAVFQIKNRINSQVQSIVGDEIRMAC